MERRNSNRIIVKIVADIISRNTSYAGFLETTTQFPGVSNYSYAGTIENLSEDGMMITIPERSELNLTNGSTLEIGFQLSSGEKLDLHCMVRWLKDKSSPQGVDHSVGIQIIDPPPIYTKFFNNRN